MLKTYSIVIISAFMIFGTCNPESHQAEKYYKAILMPDPSAMTIADSLKYLLPILDTVLLNDQKYRYGYNNMSSKEQKRVLKVVAKHKSEIQQLQQKNLAIVTGILDKYKTWLGHKDIGVKASSAMFMTLQHADLNIMEKYFPMIKDAIKNKNILPSYYAMMADRIEIRNHRPQLYGTQIMVFAEEDTAYLLPLVDPDNIDSLRKSIGMHETIEQYLIKFKITWDLSSYKAKLPDLDKKFGIKR